MSHFWRYAICGAAAGTVAGLFGAGGGLVLVPMLTALSDLDKTTLFPTSISIMLPICVVSLLTTAALDALPWQEALPYLLGSGIGGLLAGRYGRRIPVVWLHRGLGLLIIWGGIRYL